MRVKEWRRVANSANLQIWCDESLYCESAFRCEKSSQFLYDLQSSQTTPKKLPMAE